MLSTTKILKITLKVAAIKYAKLVLTHVVTHARVFVIQWIEVTQGGTNAPRIVINSCCVSTSVPKVVAMMQNMDVTAK